MRRGTLRNQFAVTTIANPATVWTALTGGDLTCHYHHNRRPAAKITLTIQPGTLGRSLAAQPPG